MWLASLLDTSDLFHFNVTGVTSTEFPENTQPSVLRAQRNKVSFSSKILSWPSKDTASIQESKYSGFRNLFSLRGKLIPVNRKPHARGIPPVPSKPGQLGTCQTGSSFTMGLLGRGKFPSLSLLNSCGWINNKINREKGTNFNSRPWRTHRNET